MFLVKPVLLLPRLVKVVKILREKELATTNLHLLVKDREKDVCEFYFERIFRLQDFINTPTAFSIF